MRISRSDWQNYIDTLARINQRAAELMESWLDSNPEAPAEQVVDTAYALATRYGEAAASLSCDMYDEIAEAQGARVPPAEPAPTATYGETAKAVYGTMKNGQSTVPATTSRLVKQAGADTILQNAARDGAEFAWVPMGDTCAFCLTLASRGWQRQSKKARDRHASHIHANCDCEYCVRFDGKSTVQGYDPDALLEQYYAAEGNTPQEKINAMRRAHYAENAPTIRAQKRAAYAARRERERTSSERERLSTSYPNTVQTSVLDAEGYKEKFRGITGNEAVDSAIYESAVEILEHRQGTNFEDLYLISANDGTIVHKLTTCNMLHEVQYDEPTRKAIEEAKKNGIGLIAIHNHPGGLPPTLDDGVSVYDNGYVRGVAVGHNLEVFDYGPTDQRYSRDQCEVVHKIITETVRFSVEFDDSIWYNSLRKFGMEVHRR